MLKTLISLITGKKSSSFWPKLGGRHKFLGKFRVYRRKYDLYVIPDKLSISPTVVLKWGNSEAECATTLIETMWRNPLNPVNVGALKLLNEIGNV